MSINDLFDMLDADEDGELSRAELHRAAGRLGWHWREAPFFAVFDLLTLREPVSRSAFIAYMHQIENDPLGPYGDVLLNSPHVSPGVSSKGDGLSFCKDKATGDTHQQRQRTRREESIDNDGIESTPHIAGIHVSAEYERLLNTLGTIDIAADEAALLLIDPQLSFTSGAWMRSIGSRGREEVKPIRQAFDNCRRFLEKSDGRIKTMFTRCPFPPESYGWNDRLAGVLAETQPYFIKPGNSVMFPPANGFREWVAGRIREGKTLLVMGGCTANSCLRVSSIETQKYFENQGLQVVVDLHLSGARASNYAGSAIYGGRSAVESAVCEMAASGVKVVKRSDWP